MSNKIVIALVGLAVILTAGSGVTGCGQSQKPIEGSIVSRISISPEEITLAPNGFQQFYAAFYDSLNNIVTNESVTISWGVSGDIGTINQNGTFTATATGDGQVTASARGISGTASISVVNGTPPGDFQLTAVGEKLFPSRTFSISWTAPEATTNSLAKFDVYAHIIIEGEEARDDSWGYLKKDIDASMTSTEVAITYDGIYDIKVRAIDSKGLWRDSDVGSSSGDTRDPSRILRAEIDAIPPLGFTLEDPPDGFVIYGKDARIRWSEAQDINIDRYELTVSTNVNDILSSAIYSATFEATATREVWLRNLPGGKYYTYIIAYDKADHYCRLNGTTDVAGYAWPDLASSWKGAWPSFEID